MDAELDIQQRKIQRREATSVESEAGRSSLLLLPGNENPTGETGNAAFTTANTGAKVERALMAVGALSR